MLHPRDTLYHRPIFFKRCHVEPHRLLVKFTLVFNQSQPIKIRLKNGAKRIAVVIRLMVLTFTTKEKLGTRLIGRSFLFANDP